jgi:ABC-type phosphate transport system auxiliary subunit
LTSETGGSGGTEEESTSEAMPLAGMSEGATQSPEVEVPTQAGPQVEGRRTQLKVVRENIHSLSTDVGNFRKSHEISIKKLEKQVAVLRSELAAQTLSRDVGSFRKSHEASSKRLEKQIATLRNELAALKSNIAKDAARSRAKQEATLSKILAKISAKSSKPAKGTKKR